MEILISLCVILVLSFILWLERELNNQPAGLRTHILIWVWSTLLMILSMEIAQLPGYINGDPGRIAAQVVTWIWFIWAWAIMKIWLNTKGLTTAANIWVTSAIWLAVWAWLYLVAIITTILILFNLIIITKIKKRIIKPYRYCRIKIELLRDRESGKIKLWKEVMRKLSQIQMDVVTKDIMENQKIITIKIISKINKDIQIYKIYESLKKIDESIKISIAENIK